jgi:uncharacterized protein (DUF4415 family)
MLVTLRLDRDVLAYFRNTGRGWQTRIGGILAKAARHGGKGRKRASSRP